MKTLKNNFLRVLVCILTLSLVGLRASAQISSQLEEKNIPVSAFSAISVEDDFEVNLVKGNCGVRVTVDQTLMPYVQVYVRSKTLYISYDEKAVPKEVKKAYKTKGAPTPVFRAVVYLPDISALTLSDNVTLMATDELPGTNFSMEVLDKAQVKTLSLRVNSATVSLKKNAQAALSIVADNKLELNTDGNASLKGTFQSYDLVLAPQGSSSQSINAEAINTTVRSAGQGKLLYNGKTDKMDVGVTGSSEIALSGRCNGLLLKGERSADVAAEDLMAQTAEVNLSGSNKVTVNVEESLDVTLTGGSVLNYNGTPAFKIGKIIKSTLAPIGTTK